VRGCEATYHSKNILDTRENLQPRLAFGLQPLSLGNDHTLEELSGILNKSANRPVVIRYPTHFKLLLVGQTTKVAHVVDSTNAVRSYHIRILAKVKL
jgi:hypothetical protein